MKRNQEKDIAGQEFGKLTALKRDGRNKAGTIAWSFLCGCGNVVTISKKRVTGGNTKSCGCIRKEVERTKPTDIEGKKFNKLTAVSYIDKRRTHRWLFRCECGSLVIRNKSAVVTGKTKDCGCSVNRERAIRAMKHGMEDTKFYKKWCDMKSNCNNPKRKDYHYYGGRGISYDPKWEEFLEFFADMYEDYAERVEEYGEKGTKIRRIHYSRNFTKENCEWVTIKRAHA